MPLLTAVIFDSGNEHWRYNAQMHLCQLVLTGRSYKLVALH
jgi:hypothetical protein